MLLKSYPIHFHISPPTIRLVICFLLSIMPTSAGDSRPFRTIPHPLSGNPGNIFLRGQAVEIKLPETTSWVCLDYEREIINKGNGSIAMLGKLPVGYYEVWPSGKTGAGPGEIHPWPISIAVLEALKAPTPLDSTICLDASVAGFYGNEATLFDFNKKKWGHNPMDIASNQATLAGVNWIRDRLSWPDTHTGPGQYPSYTVFDKSAEAQARAGLQVLQVPLTRVPSWIETDGRNRFPFDLRLAHDYFAELAERWKGKITAWEPWNEPEWIAFGGHTGAEITAMQKASYWGIRKGNPDALVGFIALTAEYIEHTENIMENDPWPYFDTMNYHQYFDLYDSGDIFDLMWRLGRGKPEWLTESGIELRWAGPRGVSALPWNSQATQARHVPKTMTVNTYLGVDAVFFFLLAHFPEGRNQFGITRADYSPRPAYVALAAAGRLMAGAKALGQITGPSDPGFKGYHFTALPDGKKREVSVIWSESRPLDYRIPARKKLEAAYNFLGQPIEVTGSTESIRVDEEAVYLIYERGAASGMDLSPRAFPALEPIPDNKPCPLVIQPLPHPGNLLRGKSHYVFEPGEQTRFPLYLYNFGDKTIRTQLEISAPHGISVTGDLSEVEVQPMDRVRFDLNVKAGQNPRTLHTYPVQIKADCGDAGVSILGLRFAYHRKSVTPRHSIPIHSAQSPEAWVEESSSGPVQKRAARGGGIAIKGHPETRRSSVAAALELKPGEHPSDNIQGIAFTITPLAGKPRYDVQIMEERGNFHWGFAFTPEDHQMGQPVRCVILFDEMEATVHPRPDDNNRVDPGQVRLIKIGCSTNQHPVEFEIHDPEWVGYERVAR